MRSSTGRRVDAGPSSLSRSPALWLPQPAVDVPTPSPLPSPRSGRSRRKPGIRDTCSNCALRLICTPSPKRAGTPDRNNVGDIENGRDAQLSDLEAVAKARGLRSEGVEGKVSQADGVPNR